MILAVFDSLGTYLVSLRKFWYFRSFQIRVRLRPRQDARQPGVRIEFLLGSYPFGCITAEQYDRLGVKLAMGGYQV